MTTVTPKAPPDALTTRGRLIEAVLRGAAEHYAIATNHADATMAAQASYAASSADVDQAAREHVAALSGTAAAPRGLPDVAELSEAEFEDILGAYQRVVAESSAPRADGRRREGLRAALACYRLHADTRPTVAAVRSGYPWLRLSPSGYEPAKLAARSVVIAEGAVYVLNPDDETDDLPWMHLKGPGDWDWVSDSDVPTHGVLVVDGASLGAAR